MPTNFLWNGSGSGAGNGYLNAAPLSFTGTTHTNTTVDTLSANQTVVKGQLIVGSQDIPSPDFIATGGSNLSSLTLLTAATGGHSGVTFSVPNFPILIGGEASGLTNGQAVTSSYWNNTGVIRAAQDTLWALYGSVFFMSGGAVTPSVGGVLTGWFLPSFDGGTTFESTLSTPSATVPALSRAPDFVISLDNAAFAAGSIRWASGRMTRLPPEADFKCLVQNNSGQTLPSTWMIGLGPAAVQF